MSIFTKVKGLRVKKNAFNLSHQVSQSQDIGQILPCYVHDGILPNSRERLEAVSVVRFQALLAPLQHKVDMYSHFWYVPYRIIDKDFPRFISGEMERKGEVYNCPVVSMSRVAKLMYLLLSAPEVSPNVNVYLSAITSPGSFFTYLRYPSFDDTQRSLFTGYDYDPETSTFGDMIDTTAFNIKRLQAYFFVIAQNYFNENFTYIFNETQVDEIDLLAQLFDFALGDFELISDRERLVLAEVPFATIWEMCLAKICVVLYTKDPNHLSFPHAWKKDYFTSALPFVQIGEDVSIPIGAGRGSVNGGNLYGQGYISQDGGTGALRVTTEAVAGTPTVNTDGDLVIVDGGNDVPISKISGDDVEISNFQGSIDFEELDATITINELRAANALQSLKEAFARFGTRFQEWLKGFWNQNSSDRSMQLPEWLGGYKVNIQISEVEQNSSSTDSAVTGEDTPLGTLAGRGIGIGGRKVFDRHFEEPGVIIGLCFLQPKMIYGPNMIDRMLLKTSNLFDYFTPQMEHLGEQEVYTGELYQRIAEINNKQVFGYQSRYAEYKFIPSQYRGQLADVLSFWHLGRIFEDQPVLSRDFVYIDSKTMRRPFAIQNITPGVGVTVDISSCLLWFNYDVKYIAPMSRFGTPMLLN